jgi:hypothetical protein
LGRGWTLSQSSEVSSMQVQSRVGFCLSG